MKVNYKFSFLGSRRYINVTQTAYGFLEVLKNNGYFESYDEVTKYSSIHRVLSDKQGYFIIDEQYDGAYNVSFSAKINDKIVKGYFVETDEEIQDSVPYDEISIIDGYTLDLDTSTVTVRIKKYNNVFNVLIALIKKLEYGKYPQDGHTPWVVGKYNIEWNMMHKDIIGKEMKVVITNQIDGLYLHIKIYIDDYNVGFMDVARNKL